MARAKKRTPKVEELRPYVEGVAKNLVEKLYGPQGPAWGTQLTEIEDVLLEIREVLTEKMFDLTLAQQAAAAAGHHAMHLRVVAQRLAPGAQYRQQAHRGPQVVRVAGQRADRFPGRPQQPVVPHARVSRQRAGRWRLCQLR